MHLEGSVTINAQRDTVWEFLTDPNSVASCAPGLESLEIVEPDKKFLVVASVGLGTVKVKFKTDVEWIELDEPNRAKMKAHGNAPGSSVDATSEMILSDGEDGKTEFEWNAEVVVVGKIASLASRLMGGVTQKLTNEFFKCMKDKIEE